MGEKLGDRRTERKRKKKRKRQTDEAGERIEREKAGQRKTEGGTDVGRQRTARGRHRQITPLSSALNLTARRCDTDDGAAAHTTRKEGGDGGEEKGVLKGRD